MKQIITLIFILLAFATSITAQETEHEIKFEEYKPSKGVPSLTDIQRLQLQNNFKQNFQKLIAENKVSYDANRQNRIPNPAFIWPVQMKTGAPYTENWTIGHYVDHNSDITSKNEDNRQDYNCGDDTYDDGVSYNHKGTDIFPFPFVWNSMDNDELEVVAAAAGTIVQKNDGEFDRTCYLGNPQSPEGVAWNFVTILHNDSSVAIYGHLKNGSVTTKSIGDTVTAGELIGVVGSSGNSRGPMLHFEVYADPNFNTLIDPFSGSCNTLNTESWWQNQKPYRDTNINAVFAHTSAPDPFLSCPSTESNYNVSNQFNIGDTVYFATYIKDPLAPGGDGANLSLTVTRPDNTKLINVGLNFNSESEAIFFSVDDVVDMNGQWTFTSTYNGQTETWPFVVTGTGIVCAAPENIASSNITETGVTFSWDEAPSALDGYVASISNFLDADTIIYQSPVIPFGTNTYTFDGITLMLDQLYLVTLRSNCDIGDDEFDERRTLFTSTLSIDDFDTFNPSIYPNPTTGVLNVKTKDKTSNIVVRDVLGRTVVELDNRIPLTSVDLSNQSNGMYFVSIESVKNQFKTIKVIKK